MVTLGLLHSVEHLIVSLLLMALLLAPSVRGLPSNGSDNTKDSNRPSLELSFTNKLVKNEVNTKNQENRTNGSVDVNSTVGSVARDKNYVSTGRPAVPQGPITKENSTFQSPLESALSTSPGPNPRTTPWLPYYFSSETAIAREAPPFPLDSGAIREGDAPPSRGRSGSPRRIDNFPTLQNQPGEEYLDAINRRTVVPPPPVVATTPSAMTTARSMIQKSSTNADRASDSVSTLDFGSTTVDSEPDIGTAFSLSEDFTQTFLGFPVSDTINDADMTAKISVPTDAANPETLANSTSEAAATAKVPGPSTTQPADDNSIDTTVEPSSTPPPVATQLPKVTKQSPKVATQSPKVTTRSPKVTTRSPPPVTTKSPSTRSPTTPESGTKAGNTPTSRAANSTGDDVAAVTVQDLPTTPPPQTTTTPAPPSTTHSPPPATKRPNLRRRLPSFRATSPRPTIRRRLPAPPTTTETTFTRSTTTVAAAPAVAEPELPTSEEAENDAESPPVTPFSPPIEPTTTRREYIMTVPPLLDFDNVARDDAASEDEHPDASLEATHLTAANNGGGGGIGIIPEGATNAIIISAIIGGCAILFFAVLMVFCMWRQHVSRRPIYPPPESSNSSSTSSTAFHNKLG